MNCPPEIEQALLHILQTGVLCGRSAGWQGDSKRCAVECDHIHNLSSLLEDFSIESLQHYYDVERVCYLDECPSGATIFGPEWDVLAGYLEHQTTT